MIGPEDEDELNALDIIEDGDDEGEGGEGSASGDTDEGVGDAGQAAAGSDGSHQGREDDVGSDEGQAGHGAPEVTTRRGNPVYGELRQTKRELAELKRRLDESAPRRDSGPDAAQLLQERQRARQAELEQARERARLEGDPTTYLEVARRHDREDFDARLAQMQFQSLDTADRSAFESLCARNPAAQSLRDAVEERLVQERRGGLNFPRETVLKFLLGERALNNGGRAKAAQQRKAAGEVQRQTVRTPNNSGRSDVSPRGARGGNEAEARAKRLENLPI